MGPVLVIGLGGFAGAIARYLVDLRVSAWTGGALPWGTFVINLSGSFLAGLLFAFLVERAVGPAELRGPLMIGFLGSYTTFSTLALETWRMLEDGDLLYGKGNLVVSIGLGVVAVVAGVALGRAV